MLLLYLSNRLFPQVYEPSYIPTKNASSTLQKSLFFVKKTSQKVTFQTAENRIFRYDKDVYHIPMKGAHYEKSWYTLRVNPYLYVDSVKSAFPIFDSFMGPSKGSRTSCLNNSKKQNQSLHHFTHPIGKKSLMKIIFVYGQSMPER